MTSITYVTPILASVGPSMMDAFLSAGNATEGIVGWILLWLLIVYFMVQRYIR